MTATTTSSSNGVTQAPPFSRLVRARDLVLDHEHWSNPRTVTALGESDIAELAADIKLRGILIPLVVQKVRVTGGRVIDLVLEGQRRTLAAMSLNPNMLVPVIDRSPEPIELDWETSDKILLDMLAVATHREGLSDFELSELAERMRNRGKKLEEIGLAIRRSESWVSRILTARGTATPKTLAAWRKGELTTEAFKDVTVQKDPGKQEERTERVLDASKTGNKAEARALAKEAAHEAKAVKSAPKKPEPVVKGPQLALIKDDKAPAAPDKPVKTPMTSRAALEDIVRMSAKRPPLHEMVKGIVLGLRYALGEIEPSEFGKPWLAYLNRAGGEIAKRHLPAKAAKKAKAAKVKPDKLAAQARKVAAKKPAKKTAGKKSKR